ncbi:hypothetical protein V5799_023859 [Amblyomma americanum]|uniref:Uncharacterized protein n=1 Tax=Amblyomma americanum TaxID=6943 RepID=A0AAQ4FGV1_AMBAM
MRPHTPLAAEAADAPSPAAAGRGARAQEPTRTSSAGRQHEHLRGHRDRTPGADGLSECRPDQVPHQHPRPGQHQPHRRLPDGDAAFSRRLRRISLRALPETKRSCKGMRKGMGEMKLYFRA